jgi:GDP-4-dehydro-6-deoxy-D-mannose reductase
MNDGHPILVTGALGFVGRWLIGDLLAAGADVVGAGRLEPGTDPPAAAWPYVLEGAAVGPAGAVRYRGEAGRWTFVPCALEDGAAVHELVASLAPAGIYHLAAQSSAGVSFRQPEDTFLSNVIGTLNLLEAVRALPAAERPRLFVSGSCEEYGAQGRRRIPLGERIPAAPVSPYGTTKAAQTLLCRQYHRSFGIPVVVARAFSHTGPGHDPRFAFPSFARQIAAIERGEREPVILVGDLSPVRDFLDVRDVIRAYRLLLEKGVPGEVYNVCSGRALTIGQGLEILLEGAARTVEVRPDPARRRPADIPFMVGDGTKLRRLCGWSPRHDLRETLGDLLAWTRKECA